MFSAPIIAMVSATSASMYSACGRMTPVTANASVALCPMVKPVTTNTRSRSRREISTSPSRKDIWSTPVKICITPICTYFRKPALRILESLPDISSV